MKSGGFIRSITMEKGTDSSADGQRSGLRKYTSIAPIRFMKRAMMDRAAKSLHPDSTIRRITGYTYRLPVQREKLSQTDLSMAETATSQQILDQEMIARVGRRDQSAFSAIYDRLSGPLYSLAMKMLGDPAEAQDALQDVFLQIWSRAGTYDPDQSSVFSWAVLLTRSRVIDRLRARGRGRGSWRVLLKMKTHGARPMHPPWRAQRIPLKRTMRRACATCIEQFAF